MTTAKTTPTLVVVLLLCASTAHADETPPPAAAPPTEAAPLPLAAPRLIPISPPPEIAPLRLAGYEYLAGAGAAALTVPATLAFGSWLGTRSNNLVATLLPNVLLFLVVPPLAVTGAEWLVGRKLAPSRTRFHPAIWAAVGASALGLVVGSLSGVWSNDGLSLSLFTLAEALVMPAAVTAVLHYTGRSKAGPPAATLVAPSQLALPEVRREEGLSPRAVSFPVLALSF